MRLIALSALAALAACAPQGSPSGNTTTAAAPAPTTAAQAAPPVPAGAYTVDKAHASLSFRVDHLGFSHYTARFTGFDAHLQLDPANPAASHVEASIDPRSLTLDNPPPGFLDELRGPMFLDTAKYPQMSFRSTAVTPTGARTARITGDLTLHGVTRPVSLDATFNGGWAGIDLDPHARAGFSAHGVLKRSDFGVGYGVPAPGTTMGVSDAVEIVIEAEFTGPPKPKAAPSP